MYQKRLRKDFPHIKEETKKWQATWNGHKWIWTRVSREDGKFYG